MSTPTPASPLHVLAADSAASLSGEGLTEASDLDHQIGEVLAAIDEATIDVSLPLSLTPADPSVPDARWTLSLYSRNCLRCDALVPEGKLEGRTRSCYYISNTACPAAQMAIEFVGARNKLLAQLKQAQNETAQGDVLALPTVMAKIAAALGESKLSEADIKWAYEEAGLAPKA